MTSEHNQHTSGLHSVQCNNDDEGVARSKECSCGSKKKHKTCGSTMEKSSETPVIKNSRTSRKGKKEVKRMKKKEATRVVQKCRSETIPDVGALCI